MSSLNPGGLIVVTGASGFLGGEIVRQASAAGLPVRATARRFVSGVEFIPSDLLDAHSLGRAMNEAAVVIHAAGLAHRFGKSSGELFDQVNRQGSVNAAKAAVAAGARRLILVSSVAVYGRHATSVDETAPCRPEAGYAASKLQAEREVDEILRSTDTRLTILRMATIYGEGDPGNVARLIHAIYRDRFVRIGKEENLKSLVYKEDAARACLRSLTDRNYETSVYNVSAPPCSMSEILEGVGGAMGKPLPRWSIPGWLVRGATGTLASLTSGRGHSGSLYSTVQKWLSNDVYEARKFENEFNFRQWTGLRDGLRREVSWYLLNVAREPSGLS